MDFFCPSALRPSLVSIVCLSSDSNKCIQSASRLSEFVTWPLFRSYSVAKPRRLIVQYKNYLPISCQAFGGYIPLLIKLESASSHL
ncbi:hypothetical protein BpHYR1_046331 [Brachionus plicatilis]|uniref:Uncharacterized protein n=1 Tax=Brachionus plicatilis TaxID=10195 RepID=A0A3M7QG35_BRAPC|nr:hypothetical protein BpHYR1_046331 [Brachionus plicatilis]